MNNHTAATLSPTVLVIFGGTGDLTTTKLLPSLFHLYLGKKLPDTFLIIGFSRKELTHTEYQNFAATTLKTHIPDADPTSIQAFCSHLQYIAGSFINLESYTTIKQNLVAYDLSIGQCTNKLFYLAVPPDYYQTIFDHLALSDVMELCDEENSWARLLVEKPFGRDLETAQILEEKLSSLFRDEQIYRIDHYLAKEAIENIIALRFANSILSDSWHGKAIESIVVTLLETKDVSNRGAFYDSIGTLRDVGQNHLLQIFALLTMSAPDTQETQSIRTARSKALEALTDSTIQEFIRGQYNGYTETHGVDDCSNTETYFKVSFTLADQVWQDTTFTLEAGKALQQQVNEAVVTFKPKHICHCDAEPVAHQHRNKLRIQFSPEQQVDLVTWMKAPGFSFTLREETLILSNIEDDGCYTPAAYERVLYDCITGEQTRFVSGAEVSAAWKFITPLLEKMSHIPLQTYMPGSHGPKKVL